MSLEPLSKASQINTTKPPTDDCSVYCSFFRNIFWFRILSLKLHKTKSKAWRFQLNKSIRPLMQYFCACTSGYMCVVCWMKFIGQRVPGQGSMLKLSEQKTHPKKKWTLFYWWWADIWSDKIPTSSPAPRRMKIEDKNVMKHHHRSSEYPC